MNIGKSEILYYASYLARDGEVAEETVKLPDGGELPFSITFVKLEDGGERRGTWTTSNNRVAMVFHGWSTAMGTASASPLVVGDYNGNPIAFQVASYSLGGINHAHVWLTLERTE